MISGKRMTPPFGRWKGRQPMAMNFKMLQFKNKNSVHLSLNGDFDGTSAHELINALKSYGSDVHQVFINTAGLTSVHPFGQVVLYRNLPAMRDGSRNLVFLGDHRRRLIKPWIQ
jgi:anti-anti-sigma regulatory factor